MFFVLVLSSFILALLALRLLCLRTLPIPITTETPVDVSHDLTPPLPPPLPTRHVSFSPPSSSSSSSIPSVQPPVQRRWSSPFQKRRSLLPDSPRIPPARLDQFGRITPSSSPPSLAVHSSQKSTRRPSTPLRLSLPGKRRSASASYPPALIIHVDQQSGTHVHSPPSPPPPTASFDSSPPLRRSKFVNPFSKSSRSRTLSPPISESPGSLSSSSPGASTSSPPAGRRMLVSKLKSIFKPSPQEPSPNINPTSITKIRRKLITRTQPYAPPWNAQMPVTDSTTPPRSLQTTTQTTSPPFQNDRKHSMGASPLSATSSTSPNQLSPRTFINELDEKLGLLQHERVTKLIPPITNTGPAMNSLF